MFQIVSVVVPLVIFFGLPWGLKRIGVQRVRYSGLLALACGVFFVSWYLPSPLIDGQDTSFTTHFVGGGIFTGLVWLYVLRNLRCVWPWYYEAASLYVLVSALGVANELFEFMTNALGLTRITLTDTSWDLVANTLGALSFYVVYVMYRATRRDSRD